MGKYTYLQLVENYREGGKVRQRVLCTLGRLDRLAERGGGDAVILSLAKFAERVRVEEAYREGDLAALEDRVVGPALVFGRLWEELGVRGFWQMCFRGGGSPFRWCGWCLPVSFTVCSRRGPTGSVTGSCGTYGYPG